MPHIGCPSSLWAKVEAKHGCPVPQQMRQVLAKDFEDAEKGEGDWALNWNDPVDQETFVEFCLNRLKYAAFSSQSPRKSTDRRQRRSAKGPNEERIYPKPFDDRYAVHTFVECATKGEAAYAGLMGEAFTQPTWEELAKRWNSQTWIGPRPFLPSDSKTPSALKMAYHRAEKELVPSCTESSVML